MAISIQAKIIGMKEALEVARTLAMPPAERRLFLFRLGRMVIAQAQKNTVDQKTIDGRPFAPRSSKSDKTGPLLKKLARTKWMGVRMLSADTAQIFYPYRKVKTDNDKEVKRSIGQVAYKHQYGERRTVTRPKYPRAFDTRKVPTRLNKKGFLLANGKKGCTANQAAALLRFDYLPPRLRAELPGGITDSVRYVMQKISTGQAHFLIKAATARCGTVNVPAITPARPFLGADNEQRNKWGQVLSNDLSLRFRAKNYAHLLK